MAFNPVKILEVIGESLVEATKQELIAIGLKDSNIIEEVSYRLSKDTVILLLPAYYKYIESGRKSGAKKVPIRILIAWMKRKGIGLSRLNETAYAIQNSIYKNGIKARPFLNKALEDAKEIALEKTSIEFKDLIDTRLKKLLKNG